jgi:hypothetical protein
MFTGETQNFDASPLFFSILLFDFSSFIIKLLCAIVIQKPVCNTSFDHPLKHTNNQLLNLSFTTENSTFEPPLITDPARILLRSTPTDFSLAPVLGIVFNSTR